MTIQETANQIKDVLENKKATDVEVIDVHDKTTLADYFVIASGNSVTQVRALADEVEYQMLRQHGLRPDHVEGNLRDRWILMDYLDIVVHVFLDEERQHYSLEKLWGHETSAQAAGRGTS